MGGLHLVMSSTNKSSDGRSRSSTSNSNSKRSLAPLAAISRVATRPDSDTFDAPEISRGHLSGSQLTLTNMEDCYAPVKMVAATRITHATHKLPPPIT